VCAREGQGKHSLPISTELLPPPLPAEFKTEKFSNSFLKGGREIFFEKLKENFADFESQFPTGAEAAHTKKESQIFLEKGSSFVVNSHDFQTFRFFWSDFMGGVYRRPVRLGLLFGLFGV